MKKNRRDTMKQVRELWKENHAIPIVVGTIVLSLTFLFFMISKPLFQAPEVVTPTLLKEKIRINDVAYELIGVYENETGSDLVVTLGYDVYETTNTSIGEIEITPQLKDATIKDAEVEILKGSDQFYVLSIKHIPKTWTTLRIQIGEKNQENKATMYVNKQNTEVPVTTFEKGNFYPTQAYAEVHASIYEREMMERQKYKKVTQPAYDVSQTIAKTMRQIDELEKSKSYKTEQEKQEIDQKIKSKQEEIKQLNTQEKQYESMAKEYDERIKNLSQKTRDLKQTYGIVD